MANRRIHDLEDTATTLDSGAYIAVDSDSYTAAKKFAADSLQTAVDIGGLTPTDGNFIVGNGSAWVAESGATARTSLGLGTMATEATTSYLAATGATTGATSQAQTFTNGVVTGAIKPTSDSTTALQLQTSAGTAVVTVDTVNSITYVRGNISSAPLGSELITNGTFATNDFTGWTAGANWSAATGAAVHTAGSTETLAQNVTVSSGTSYQIVFTTAGRTAGSIAITLGAVTLDVGSGTTAITTNSTQTLSIAAAVTGSVALTITPTSDYDGSIDSISLKAISASQAALVVTDDVASDAIEVRGVASLATNAIGTSALQANTTGLYNTAIGTSALQANTTGSYNTAIGTNALYSNTIGNSNNASGASALQTNTTGVFNNAMGTNALRSNTTGSYNNAMGTNALRSNTTGSNNNAIGTNALYTNTTGSTNTANGTNALYFNTASNNTAIGDIALFTSTSGAANTAVGARALYSNTTGSNNTANGYQAGRYINSGAANQTSSNSVYIGYDTRASASGNSNEVVIGYQGRGNGSNTTTIGNSSTAHFYAKGIHVLDSGDAPASAAATGTAGSIVWDADYIYVCTATDTWKRAAIATW